MIMAGRGRRLEIGDKPKVIGISAQGSASETVDFATVKELIDQLNVTDLNYATLMSIRDRFSHICSTRDSMVDLLSYLHDKALFEAEFGEKLVIIFEEMSNLEVNGALLRGELLTLIQNDFEKKDTLCKSDPKKFINAVMLLGGVYNKIKVCGAPIAVLGFALLEYFDFLIKGGEEELKALTKQVLINGKTLLEASTFEKFHIKLRDALISNSLNSKSKCWILLIIDLISNNFKPPKGPLDEFYVSNLKNGYTELEKLFSVPNNMVNHSPQSVKSVTKDLPQSVKSVDKDSPQSVKSVDKDSPQSVKSVDKDSPQSVVSGDSTSPKKNQFESDCNTANNSKKNLTKRFSDLTVKTEMSNLKGRKDKNQLSPGKNPRKENWKQNMGRHALMSGHDDRFVKEENYYGVQMPRKDRVENRKLDDDKIKMKESVESKSNTDFKTDVVGSSQDNETWD